MIGSPSLTHGHEFESTLGDSEGQRSLDLLQFRGGRISYDLATEQ